MFQSLDFRDHRKRLLANLQEDEAVLVFGAPTRRRNGDSDYRYRPNSDLFWLSGWEDPQCAAFLRPGGDETFVLFVQPRDPAREVWDGRRPGPEGAINTYGADAAYTFAELEEELPRLLEGVTTLHHQFALDPDNDAVVMASINRAARAGRRKGFATPQTFHVFEKTLHELRLHKTAPEIAVMREAAALTDQGHRAAMAFTRPGVHEYEVEAVLRAPWDRGGSTGPAYTPIVAAGDNATVLHYVTNRDVCKAGELLLIDAGCEVAYYACDVTRTFPVDGTFTPAQRDAYEVVLAAQLASIDACRAGRSFDDVHAESVRVLTEGMVSLGLLSGTVDELIEKGEFRKYYMHSTSHWLGLDVHDVGTYAKDGDVRRLTPGVVLTVEPGLYVAADDETAPDALRGLGIRIEDDVHVTDGDPDVITGDIPKRVTDVEAACQATLAHA
ncbi:MAG: aminopeptidase P N-terminal domain-containing protein [Myxococcota bacterium]